MPRLTESRALRAKLPQQGQDFIWCSEIAGFGVRLTSGSRSYIVQCRFGDKTHRLTLGPVGTLPFEGPPHAPGARDLATAALNAARRGEDPRIAIGRKRNPDGVTLGAVWKIYRDTGFPKLKGTEHKRTSTIRGDINRYGAWLDKQLGAEAVANLDTPRVRRWLDKIPSEGQRSHALALLKTLLSFAASRGLAKGNDIAIVPSKSREQQDFYSPEELARLDDALAALTMERPQYVLSFGALRLLIATGGRLGEILSLRWDGVDLEQSALHLEKDKTSKNRRDILLPAAALGVLKSLPRTTSPFVFFSDAESGHLRDVQRHWLTAIERAGVRRLRKHDLRHSFASTAIRQGVGLYVVGKLLGHRQATTTARYAHLEQDVAREALERIAKAMGGAG